MFPASIKEQQQQRKKKYAHTRTHTDSKEIDMWCSISCLLLFVSLWIGDLILVRDRPSSPLRDKGSTCGPEFEYIYIK